MNARFKTLIGIGVIIVFVASLLLCCCSQSISKVRALFSNAQGMKSLSACCQRGAAQHPQSKCKCHTNLSLESSKKLELNRVAVKTLHYSASAFSAYHNLIGFIDHSIPIARNNQPPPETLQNLTLIYLQKSTLQV